MAEEFFLVVEGQNHEVLLLSHEEEEHNREEELFRAGAEEHFRATETCGAVAKRRRGVIRPRRLRAMGWKGRAWLHGGGGG